MSRTVRLLVVIGQAACLYTGTCFLVAFPLVWLTPPATRLGPVATSLVTAIFLLACLGVPGAFVYLWIVRKLRAYYSRRQAKKAGLTFAVFAPAPLMIGLVVGEGVGGYSSTVFGTDRGILAASGALIGVFGSVSLVIALLTFVAALLALHHNFASGDFADYDGGSNSLTYSGARRPI